MEKEKDSGENELHQWDEGRAHSDSFAVVLEKLNKDKLPKEGNK